MDHPDLEDLYLKKLEGTLSPEEESYLDRRLQGNASDKIEFEKIDALWKATRNLSLEKGVSRKDRWTRLQQGIRLDERPRSVPLYRTFWRYAAVVWDSWGDPPYSKSCHDVGVRQGRSVIIYLTTMEDTTGVTRFSKICREYELSSASIAAFQLRSAVVI